MPLYNPKQHRFILKILKNKTTATYRDRGSKFIGRLFPCAQVSDFDNALLAAKSEFPDATHHCYAYRINPAAVTEYSSDDGEPSGTAGLPILNQLKSFDAVNAGLIVIRYYGGTNLGKPGLIEAYGTCAAECLKTAVLKTVEPVRLFAVSYPYTQENLLQRHTLSFSLTELNADYQADIKKIYACPVEMAPDFEKALQAGEHLGVEFEKREESFVEKTRPD